VPSLVYKLLLRQLVKTNPYNRLYLGYASLRFYNIAPNVDQIKLCPLYKFRLVIAYNRQTYKRL
jgi:hypothetical protein